VEDKELAELYVILSSLDSESELYASMREAIHIIELVNDGELVSIASRNESYE
jgi:hypothetical protein